LSVKIATAAFSKKFFARHYVQEPSIAYSDGSSWES